MKNYRSEKGAAIRRFSVRKDSEHGICVAVRLPIPPVSTDTKGAHPCNPALKGDDANAKTNR